MKVDGITTAKKEDKKLAVPLYKNTVCMYNINFFFHHEIFLSIYMYRIVLFGRKGEDC